MVIYLLSGTLYGAGRVTVGEDGQPSRVRRHGEHERGLPRNGRLPDIRPVLTVTVTEAGDRLAQSRFQTVRHQHDLAPSAAGT
jgi:hypothetical protein